MEFVVYQHIALKEYRARSYERARLLSEHIYNMFMSRLAKDLNRTKFIKRGNFDLWECKDYKTFYMTIRRQNHNYDSMRGLDCNKYTLCMSHGSCYHDIDTLELAMEQAYNKADYLYTERLK